MSRKTKIWFIAAVFLIIIGSIVFGGVMAMLKGDFTKLSTVKYESNTYQIEEEFNNISVDTNTEDITFLPSQNNQCKIECYEEKNLKHSIIVEDKTLKIKRGDKKWYENIGINFGSPKITVYMPSGDYGAISLKNSTGDVKIPKNFIFESIDISASTGEITNYSSASGDIKIKASTGNITVQGISANTIDLSVSTGKIRAESISTKGNIKIKVSTGKVVLADVKCKNVISSGSTGSITLKNVIASGEFSIKRSTGDVKFEKCDANEMLVKTDTGDVKGSLLSDKVFITESDTGIIKVPKTTKGGKCEIITDTGDIKITIE